MGLVMSDPGWLLCGVQLEETPFLQAVIDAHQTIYQEHFADELMLNHQLGIQLRAYRELDDWRLLLILTPWMLSRLIFPRSDPGIPIPAAWQQQQREEAEYQLLGPAVELAMLGQNQRAHLNYYPQLGHYLLQPIALNMQQYDSAEAVFEAWNEVITTRDQNMKKLQRDCPWQKELSRREFFGRLSR
ncbi:Protein of unknown function (DUF3457) [endosymbiont of Ridgeia piscesae]|jgi:hypothetical protein|uniref:Uncharacterized protein n=2 Tax=endosymbiont of Ridgeia piscesae TaxID=54398 RepID=A0A0T5Z1C7_9GAMM|nr:Protein of unknown function (DUF3457) [endosymbiont of Ridgeia piscesae]KRT58658.1 Protein of unknown function (DUF3457) [endosymbiont of Ridgeia piscesae]